MKPQIDTVKLLVANGYTKKKAQEIARHDDAWKIRKRILENPVARVPVWRCPVHGCLLEVAECVECKIARYQKVERIAKVFKGET